jgi:hypothetical protein
MKHQRGKVFHHHFSRVLKREMSYRKSFTDNQKRIIFESCNRRCFYCKQKLSFGNHMPGKYTEAWGSWQIEHLVGYAEGIIFYGNV